MRVTFNINFHTVWGQKLCIVGSVPELGAWEPALSKEMNYKGNGNWQLELELTSPVQQIEYQYVLCEGDKLIFEEWERKHQITFSEASEHYIMYDYWLVRPFNLAFYSSAFTKGLFFHPNEKVESLVKSGKKLALEVFVPRVEKDQYVAITGNQSCLGNWNAEKALPLHCKTAPVWTIELDAEEISFPLEYKFLICENPSVCYWEEGDNRSVDVSQLQVGETVVVSGLYFRENLPLWRCAGSVIPVFSLRSEQSFGVGDLGDLRLLVDWAKKTQQRIIQVLPMNDTTTTHTWVDSYPYSAISIYALHPMYISLSTLGKLSDSTKNAFFVQKQAELNALEVIHYEQAVRYKITYCREFFKQEGEKIIASSEYQEFVANNESWLKPYAAYCYLRDTYHTSDFAYWKEYAIYDKNKIWELCSEDSIAYPEVLFVYFLQYVLHTQFKSVSDYARQNGVVLKGDLPIGVSRTSVEAWMEPRYFNMNGQAGAPPDDFSVCGQNWSFPTYNWGTMAKDGYTWWEKRFHKLEDYFDCFRIDHILGFFRIWEVPLDYVQGLCGHFNAALPFTCDEIEQYGLSFNEARFTTPHIHQDHLPVLFGDLAEEVKASFLAQSSSNHYVLKPFCDTQRKIESILGGKTDEASQRIKQGLFAIANEVLFIRDPRELDKFHPRISAYQSYIYKELSEADRSAFDRLYWHFFYHRHNEFWKAQALKRLTPLVGHTSMLVCGEDLGMIPESVPDVMNRLQIFSLEIERMPKQPNREFSDMNSLPYYSVCTTSTHDMSPLRSWWKEDEAKTQRYYNNVLGHEGDAPADCSAELATEIVANHLATRSMLTIIPLQDWMAMDESIRRVDYEAERINIPANAHHCWCYRMHITLEQLLEAENLNTKIVEMIKASGRK
jgi:4-alpha-glucanotransferase